MERKWHDWRTGLKWLGIFLAIASLVGSLWMGRAAILTARENRSAIVSRIQQERRNPPLTEARVRQVVREELSRRAE